MLLAKYFIYQCRCAKESINIFKFKKTVYQIKKVEKYIAVKNNKLVKFGMKWDGTVFVQNEINDYVNQYLNQL